MFESRLQKIYHASSQGESRKARKIENTKGEIEGLPWINAVSA